MSETASLTHRIQCGLAFLFVKIAIDQQHSLGGFGVLGSKKDYEESRQCARTEDHYYCGHRIKHKDKENGFL